MICTRGGVRCSPPHTNPPRRRLAGAASLSSPLASVAVPRELPASNPSRTVLLVLLPPPGLGVTPPSSREPGVDSVRIRGGSLVRGPRKPRNAVSRRGSSCGVSLGLVAGVSDRRGRHGRRRQQRRCGEWRAFRGMGNVAGWFSLCAGSFGDCPSVLGLKVFCVVCFFF